MSKLRYIKIKDILAIFQFLFIWPFALIAKIFIHDLWLIAEEKYEARDNGFWLFKYICENHPQQKIAYAIDKKSVDYKKVKNIGKVVSYGTLSHWFWYLVAKKNISSQKGGKPNAAVCYLFEVAIPILRTKRYFLQHGITINDGKWLYYPVCKFRMFICGAKPEYLYIKEKFGYPQERVKYLGFPRFDTLHDVQIDDDLILVMPTWREWLARNAISQQDFCDTVYYKKWNEFLNSERLKALLDKYNKRLLFYPHRNMQKYLSNFSSPSDKIEFADWQKYDIQDVLKKAYLMITDYSSVFFDFAYMKKPVIFYQFDENEFRQRQYQEGYFDYHNNPLGMWSGGLDSCLDILENQLKQNVKTNDNISDFFTLYDSNNCKRIYHSIKND